MASEDGFSGDGRAHVSTYDGFITLLKVGTAASAILALIVILLIAN